MNVIYSNVIHIVIVFLKNRTCFFLVLDYNFEFSTNYTRWDFLYNVSWSVDERRETTVQNTKKCENTDFKFLVLSPPVVPVMFPAPASAWT